MHAYLITNTVNGKGYIGIARDIRRRWRQHKNQAPTGTTVLCEAMRKYGIENFSFEVIAATRSWEDLIALETILIVQHRTFYGERHGYNMTMGGEGPNCIERTALHKEILSAKAKKQWGTQEFREKMIATHLGSKRSAETCARISAARKKRGQSPAAIAALKAVNDARRAARGPREYRVSLSRKECGILGGAGLSASPDGRRRIGEANRRRVISEETKAKISASSKGRPVSAETIAKRRAALARRNPQRVLDFGETESEDRTVSCAR